MHKSGHSISFWSAVSMGIGSMIGAGIFALLGEAGTIAGAATYISFLLGGVIALLSGYSIGKLGATWPAAGGIVEYLGQAFGVGLFSGAMSVMMYIAAVVSIALVAKAFGAYAFSMLPAASPLWLKPVLSVSVVLAFVLVNLGGARNMARLEKIVVAVKLAVLTGFGIAGLFTLDPARLSVSEYPPTGTLFFSLAITFFAYEGFRVITNAAEDMPDPKHTVPRAIMTAILIAMALYTLIAIVVFGNLPVADVIKARDFALAEAARPVFGEIGFRVIAVAALVATASSINASMYAVTNVAYQLARNGQLPGAFGRPVRGSREGLIISAVFIAAIAAFFNLGQIAILGSLSILIVHLVTHVGHLKLTGKTGASTGIVAAAVLANLTAIVMTLWYESRKSPATALYVLGFVAAAFLIELALRRFTDKRLALRLPRV